MSLKYKIKKDLVTLGIITATLSTLTGCSNKDENYKYFEQQTNDEYEINNLAMLEFEEESKIKRIFVSYYIKNDDIVLSGITDNKIRVIGNINKNGAYDYSFELPELKTKYIYVDYNIGNYITKSEENFAISYDEIIEIERNLNDYKKLVKTSVK